MLRLTVSTEEYLLIGDDIKLVFLGGTGKHLRIMIDAPRNKNILRSSVLEKDIMDPERRANLPKYYAQVEHPEKYVKKRTVEEGREAAGRETVRREETGHPAAQREEVKPRTAGAGETAPKKSRIIIARGSNM